MTFSTFNSNKFVTVAIKSQLFKHNKKILNKQKINQQKIMDTFVILASKIE